MLLTIISIKIDCIKIDTKIDYIKIQTITINKGLDNTGLKLVLLLGVHTNSLSF